VKVFLDTNVVLDFLADRVPFAEAAAGILALAERGRLQAFVAAHTITTICYLISRDAGVEVARFALLDLFDLVEVVPVDRQRLLQALAMGGDDFEDAVQAVCAMVVEADFLVTRNPQDFPPITTEVILPEPFLAQYQESSSSPGQT